MSLRAFEISDWGFVRFMGPDAKEFLQGLVTADMRKLAPGVMLPACVLTPKGLLTADCELYEETPQSVLAVMRPAAVVGFLKTFDKRIMLSRSSLKCLRAQTAWLVIGEGCDKGLPWDRLAEPARLLMSADPPVEAEPLTRAEFEDLRVAAGFPWYGLDMDETVLPLEARQESAISLDKGCYMGQETVSRVARIGHVNRILAGLRFSGAAPAAGTVLRRGGTESGKVTSVAGRNGIGMVRLDDSAPGTKFDAAEVREIPAWPEPLGGK